MSDEERHGMRGWGSRLGVDINEPRSREDAMLTAMMSANDRLVELFTVLQDIQNKLTRMEVFLEETIPGYSESSAYKATRSEQSPDFVRRIPIAAGSSPS